jgi:PhoD-like phosphatase
LRRVTLNDYRARHGLLREHADPGAAAPGFAGPISNPVILAGDIHSSWFNNLSVNFDDPTATVVAAEFVATRVSSDFPAAFVPFIEAASP